MIHVIVRDYINIHRYSLNKIILQYHIKFFKYTVEIYNIYNRKVMNIKSNQNTDCKTVSQYNKSNFVDGCRIKQFNKPIYSVVFL